MTQTLDAAPPDFALTLTQPWATLCVALLLDAIQTTVRVQDIARQITVLPGHAPKRHETRTFRPPAKVIGKRLAIHAGRGDANMRDSIVRDGNLVEPYASTLIACGYSKLDPWGIDAGRRRVFWRTAVAAERAVLTERDGGRPLRLGAVVGFVTVVECVHTIRFHRQMQEGKSHWLDFLLGNWDPDRFAWYLAHPNALLEPVPCRGMQQVWTIDTETRAALARQLEAPELPL